MKGMTRKAGPLTVVSNSVILKHCQRPMGSSVACFWARESPRGLEQCMRGVCKPTGIRILIALVAIQGCSRSLYTAQHCH